MILRGPRFLLISILLASAASAKAQLPDAPSAREIAPLKRYSLSVGIENTYSYNTLVLNATPKIGVSIRLGERETIGFSYSHAIALNQPLYVQNNSVVAYVNLRVVSWGKIPR